MRVDGAADEKRGSSWLIDENKVAGKARRGNRGEKNSAKRMIQGGASAGRGVAEGDSRPCGGK